AEGQRVQMAEAEPALPAAVCVVPLGYQERRVFGRERAGAVTGLVSAGDAEPGGFRLVPALAQQRLRILERRRGPGRIRVEAAPLVEQDALRALEDARAGP